MVCLGFLGLLLEFVADGVCEAVSRAVGYLGYGWDWECVRRGLEWRGVLAPGFLFFFPA